MVTFSLWISHFVAADHGGRSRAEGDGMAMRRLEAWVPSTRRIERRARSKTSGSRQSWRTRSSRRPRGVELEGDVRRLGAVRQVPVLDGDGRLALEHS